MKRAIHLNIKAMLKISLYAFLIAGICSIASINNAPPVTGCSIYGSIQTAGSGEAIPYANVYLYVRDSVLVSQSVSGNDGAYCFKNLAPGKYKLAVNYTGYQPKTIRGIVYSGKGSVKMNVAMSADRLSLEEVELQKTPATEKKHRRAPYGGKDKSADLESMGLAANTYPGQVNTYNQPADFNTENYSKINDNEFKDADKNPLSTFSIDVDKASYSNMRRFIMQGQQPPADAVRVEEMINYFSYNYPEPKGKHPFSITTQYMDCPWNPRHNLIHVGIQGKNIALENMPANNLVFLLDVSGSMEDANKLPLLKSGLRLLIDQMRPQDRVAIVVYAGAAGVVLPSTPGNQKEKIIEALENLQAGGSTAGGEGILLAYKTARENFMKEGNNRVILATDGDFNVGVSSDGELVRLFEKQREGGVFLTVLGFGTGNYKDSKMEQLADKGNGNYAYIDNILEAKKTLVKEMGGTLLTIAKDVKIQIEFNPAKVKAYRLVGYENRLLNNEDFNDDKKDAGELGSGHTVTAIYEIIPAGSEELTASVDSLKYQKNIYTPRSTGNEVMTIKFRYKEPKEDNSQLITEVVQDKKTVFASASDDARFSAVVAEFGMLLRDSQFKGSSNYRNILALARSAKGKDEDGYRAEFIRLVEMAELLKK
jgi:Ca-activated chloride channel family protein